jgi:hypothetical protein
MWKWGMRRLGVVLLIGVAIGGCTSKSDKVWISGWKQTSSLSIPRSGAATVTHNGFIYVIAGVDGREFLRTTEFAKIQPDGSLGPWQAGTLLNEERGFTEAVVKNGSIYVVGGGNGPNGQHLLRSVERAAINPDGSLGPWVTEQNHTILPRRCTKLGLIGDVLYSFGGFGGTLLDSVEYATIGADGKVGQWKMASESMTMPRYVNSVKAVDGAAYVLGGHDQAKGVGITNVEWTRPTATGDMKGWAATTPMQTGRYGLASTAIHDRVYVFGGLTGLEYLSSVEMSDVLPAGGLGQWRNATAMSVPRAMFNVVKADKWVYVIGGTNRDGYMRSVEYTGINKAGELGFFGTPQEQAAYQQQQQQRQAAAARAALPNSGVVKQILQTQMYSYVEVVGDNGVVWLAGPKIELPVNTRIRYSKGVYMSNFFSKELQRSFPAVTFVSRIEAEH